MKTENKPKKRKKRTLGDQNTTTLLGGNTNNNTGTNAPYVQLFKGGVLQRGTLVPQRVKD